MTISATALIEVIVGNVGSVYLGNDPKLANQQFREYVEISKAGYGMAAREPVTMIRDGEILREYRPSYKLPTITELSRLIVALKKTIGDDYRAYDDCEEDSAPSMLVTVGANERGEWSYQTGDNSYTGGAYGFPHWAVVAIDRRSNSKAVARDIQSQLSDLMHQ